MKTRFRFLFILIPIAYIALGGIVLMALWNWLMPALFGLGVITYPQALGLLILLRILFWRGRWIGWRPWGGYAFAPAGGGYHSPFYHHRYYWWKNMKEKWDQMGPEEKEQWKARCRKGFWDESSRPEEPVKA
jgi:hypothetical protein